jgi:hypothetical protein
MVPIASLWLPILLSAVFVFVLSFVLHMLLPIHRNDFRKLPREDEVMAALRGFAIPPGDYMTPCGGGPESMKDPAFLEKYKQGPVALYTFMKGGTPSMTANLVQWFLYGLAVGVFAAYVAGRALPAGAHYLQVFRFAGVTAYLAYAFALFHDSIWYHRAWSTTVKYQVDGLLYALVTAGTFGWLWPR